MSVRFDDAKHGAKENRPGLHIPEEITLEGNVKDEAYLPCIAFSVHMDNMHGMVRASGENKILELQPLLLTRVDR